MRCKVRVHRLERRPKRGLVESGGKVSKRREDKDFGKVFVG